MIETEYNGLSAKKLKWKSYLKKLGITQLTCASVSFIIGICLIAFGINFNGRNIDGSYRGYHYLSPYSYNVTGSGVWSSTLTIVAGILAIFSSFPRRRKGVTIAHMVLAIIGCCMEVFGILVTSLNARDSLRRGLLWFRAANIILSILGVIDFALLITTSVLACRLTSCCCGENFQSNQQVTYVPQPMIQTSQGVMMLQQSSTIPSTYILQQPQVANNQFNQAIQSGNLFDVDGSSNTYS